MKLWRYLFIAGFVLAAIMTYFLRDVIADKVAVPLAYSAWQVGLFFRSIPEEKWLMGAVIAISMIAYASLMSEDKFARDSTPQDLQPVPGPVEELTMWLIKSPRHAYYRWLAANQVARLARLFLMHREGRNVQRWDGLLESPDWDPPEDVKIYLKYGLNRPFSTPRSKPLSSNLLKAVEYLESKIEDRDDGN